LQYYTFVLQILNSVNGISSRGHMSTSRVYKPIYTVKNLYN